MVDNVWNWKSKKGSFFYLARKIFTKFSAKCKGHLWVFVWQRRTYPIGHNVVSVSVSQLVLCSNSCPPLPDLCSATYFTFYSEHFQTSPTCLMGPTATLSSRILITVTMLIVLPAFLHACGLVNTLSPHCHRYTGLVSVKLGQLFHSSVNCRQSFELWHNLSSLKWLKRSDI